jgi:hypothetical protein
MGQSKVGSGRRSDLLNSSAAYDDFAGGINIGDGSGRLEIGDGRIGDRLFLGGVVGIVCALVSYAREQLGGYARAAVHSTELGILDHGMKRVFRGGHAVGAGFARQVDRNGGTRPSVFSVVGPGIAGRFVGDLGRVESDRWVAGSIQAFRTFLADAQTPGGIIPGGEEKNRKVFGLRC